MALQNFNKISISLHNANDPIMKKLFAKEGDRNGRELEVQLNDGHSLQSANNLNLRLYWKHLAQGNQGIEPFEKDDNGDGLFNVTYPDSMMNAGNVEAWIQIQDGSKLIGSVNVLIVIQGSGFDAMAVVASDDYKALNDALNEVNRWQSQIDVIKNNLQQQADALLRGEEAKFDALEAEYRNTIDGLRTQFNDAVANLTVDSELITARTSTETGDSYETVGERLDEIETMIVLENHKAYFELANGRPRLRLEEI